MISFGKVTCTFASGLYLIWKSRHWLYTLLLGNFSSSVSRYRSTQFVQRMNSLLDQWRTYRPMILAQEGQALVVPALTFCTSCDQSQAIPGEELSPPPPPPPTPGRLPSHPLTSCRWRGFRGDKEREGGALWLVPFQGRPWWRGPPKGNKREGDKRAHIPLSLNTGSRWTEEKLNSAAILKVIHWR